MRRPKIDRLSPSRPHDFLKHICIIANDRYSGNGMKCVQRLGRINNSAWQGCQSLKITFEELAKVDVGEIREILDTGDTSERKDIL